MPPPLLLTTILLIGWPLLQLASVLAVRPRRRRLHVIVAELRSDGRYREDDRALVERVARGADAKAAMVLAPFLLFPALTEIVAAFLGRVRRSPVKQDAYANLREMLFNIELRSGGMTGAETVQADARFETLRRLSFEISCLRRPLSLLLTAVTCLPLLPVLVLAFGVRETSTAAVRTLALLVHALSLVALGLPTLRHR